MSLKVTVEEMRQLLQAVTEDLAKAISGNKAASQRVRVTTVDLEKAAKKYRKESIQAERGVKKSPKKAKAPAKAKAKAKAKPVKNFAKPAAKKIASPKAKLAIKSAAKKKAPAKKHPSVKPVAKKPVAKKAKGMKPLATAFKRPTAKLPRYR